MDYIGGMLNPIGKMPKHTRKMNFVMVLLEKANGILMETIGISVMGYFGLLLLFFLQGRGTTRLEKHPTGFGEHCQVLETIEHILSCTRHESQRRNIMEELRITVLSGTGIKDMLQICVNGKGRIHIFNFLIKKGLMGLMS